MKAGKPVCNRPVIHGLFFTIFHKLILASVVVTVFHLNRV